MEDELVRYVLSNISFGALFVWLLWDTRRESKSREEKLQGIINKNQKVISELADKINIVKDIKEDVEEIKNKIFK